MIYGTNFFHGRITGIRSGQMSNVAQLPTDINYTAEEKKQSSLILIKKFTYFYHHQYVIPTMNTIQFLFCSLYDF